MAKVDLEAEIDALSRMHLDALRHLWRTRVKSDPPKVSAGLLRLAFAYAMQEKAIGGLSVASVKQLEAFAAAGRSAAKVTRLRTTRPGMRLVRVWNGVAHVVTVNEAGEVEWNGRTWRSLSEVARIITGTQWSGPKFFGLRDRKDAA
ncbi:MAG: DUF2924 domain-containing protein [Sandaracinobacter sp.]